MTFDELKRLMGDIHDVLYDVAARGCDEPHDIRNCLACRAYTARVEIMDFDPDAVALANGYVKAEVPITSMHDPRLTAKKTEPWHIDIDSLARSAGYVKLEPGQVVVNASDVGDALEALCDTCAGECSMCRVKDVLSAIKEARDARV